jgi:hypothetical protein
MAEARIEMSAADRNVLSLTQSIAGGFDKIVASMERTEKRSATLQQSTDRMFSSIGSGVRNFAVDIGKLAIGLAGIQSAGAMIMAEYEKFKQKMANSAQVGQTFAGSIAAATRNAPAGMTGMQIEHMTKLAAQSAGIEATQVAAAIGPMFAAGGDDVSPEKYAQIAVAGGPLSFGSPGDYKALLAGTAGFSAMSGRAGQDHSPQAVMGFLQQASAGSRVDKMEQYGPAVGGVHAAATAKGFDISESTAVFNALTHGGSDEDGSRSKTATMDYLTALDHARVALGMPKESSPKRIIAELQKPENARARAVFLRNLKGEKSHLDVMKTSVTAGSVGDQFFQAAFAKTPSMAAGQASYDESVGNMLSSPSISALLPAEAIKSATQSNLLDPRMIEAGAVRGAFDAYNASGSGLAIKDTIDMAAFDMHVAQGGDATDFVKGKLAAKAKSLRTPTTVGGFGMAGMGRVSTQEPTAADLQRAEGFEKLVEVLERIDRNTAKAVQGQTVTPNGERPALPGARN